MAYKRKRPVKECRCKLTDMERLKVKNKQLKIYRCIPHERVWVVKTKEK